MAATLNILLPTGRRRNVKVTANTRLLQVIEDICSKIGYDSNEYTLKHQRSILDPSLSVRYANLPNNCKLELVKADKPRKESTVHIALQIESGERLQMDFVPSSSLWDVLEHWESETDSPYAGKLTESSVFEDDSKTTHPVCIYLRQEIVGEAWLRATTLKSLGLTGGKAIIRLLHRAVDLPAPPAAPSSKAPPSAPVQSSSQPSVPTSQGQSTLIKRDGDDDGDQPMEVQVPDAAARPSQTNQQDSGGVPATNVERTETLHDHKESPAPNSEESQSMDVDEPADMKQRTMETSGGHSSEGTGARPKQSQQGQVQISNAQQQVLSTPLSPELEQQAIEMGAALAEAILRHRTDQQLAQLKNSWSGQAQSQPTFTDFKFPEQPRVQSSSSSLQVGSSKPPEPCDRQPLVFNLDHGTGERPSALADAPDDFFEVTMDDMRRMMASQHILKVSDGEQPLLTKAMREAQELKKAKEYSKVVIRIQFPDRHILQGFFRPLEPVRALRDFIKGHLQDPAMTFYLYTTPPRCVLKDDTQSLFKAKLFPAAVVHFGTEKTCDHYLRLDLVGEVASFAKAKEEAASTLQRIPSLDEAQLSSGPSSSRKSDASGGSSSFRVSDSAGASGKQQPHGSAKRQATGESAVNSEKIPKWFKMGKR